MIYGDKEDLCSVVRTNAQRRQSAFEDAKHSGTPWLVECRDMWDRFDPDAGIYFCPYADLQEVDACADRCTPDALDVNDRLMGIYHTSLSLEEQGPGISRAQWMDLRERHDTPEAILLARGVTPCAPQDSVPNAYGEQVPWWWSAALVLMVLGTLLLLLSDC